MSASPDRAPDERPPADAPPQVPAERTANTDADVEEALLETFPASDAPGYTGGAVTPTDYEGDDAPDDEEE